MRPALWVALLIAGALLIALVILYAAGLLGNEAVANAATASA
ncbi:MULTISPECIES: hypothetical protein [unclassified Cryobacterium]|nr:MULTISPECIES: hypothetical protein [unclassified Cryobacterium]